jgi:phage gp46-like protein
MTHIVVWTDSVAESGLAADSPSSVLAAVAAVGEAAAASDATIVSSEGVLVTEAAAASDFQIPNQVAAAIGEPAAAIDVLDGYVKGLPRLYRPTLPPRENDIRLVQQTDFPNDINIDFQLQWDGTLDQSQALATAVIVALGTNRLALSSDILPDPDSNDRMGWWGDLDAQEIWGGWPIGSRLWLLRRSKIVGPQAADGATVTRVEQYIREAIQPFIDLRVASGMYVKAQRVGLERIDALVQLYRGPELAVNMRYQVLWSDIPAVPMLNYYP